MSKIESTIIMLCPGKYPSNDAGSKRVSLYIKGLEAVGVRLVVQSTYQPIRNRYLFYLKMVFEPFFAIYYLCKNLSQTKVFFIYGFSWITLLLLRVLTFVFRKRIVIELNEKPGSVYTSRYSSDNFISRLSNFALMKWVFPLIDGFVVISRALEEFLMNEIRGKKHIICVPILIEPIDANQTVKPIDLCVPFIIHSGALSERKDGVIGLFEALAIVNTQMKSELHLFLTDNKTDCYTREKIDSIIEANQLHSFVHYIGFLSEEELLNYQLKCEMLVLNKPFNEQNQYNFATKLGEYMRLGKPVIYTPVGDMNTYLQDKISGYKISFDSPTELAEAIMFILKNKKEALLVGEEGRKIAEKEFNYRLHGKRLGDFLSNIIRRE